MTLIDTRQLRAFQLLARTGSFTAAAKEMFVTQSAVSHSIKAEGGLEALILEGAIVVGGEPFGQHDWIRIPDGASAEITAGSEGARLWIKRGHLRDIRVPDQA